MSKSDVSDDLIGHRHVIDLQYDSNGGPVSGSVRDTHSVIVDDSGSLDFGGEDRGPSAIDYLVLGLVGCQLSSLAQCLRKARIDPFEIQAKADLDGWSREDIDDDLPENLVKRIEHISVSLDVGVEVAERERAKRCLDIHDQGCVVGQSLEAGINYSRDTSISSLSE